MSKKKENLMIYMMQNQLMSQASTSGFADMANISPKKHKKHKHKKHKRNKREDEDDSGSPDAIGSELNKPSLKLKIRIGGQTLGEKSVIKTEIPDPESDDSEDDGSDEEDAWLQALESGRLEEVDDELRKMKDPMLMTARQAVDLNRYHIVSAKALTEAIYGIPSFTCKSTSTKTPAIKRALLESKSQKDREEPGPPPAPQKEMTEEMIQRRMIRAKKRKQQAEEKKEKDKKQTIERLLKKTDAKIKGLKKLSKKADHPKVTYIVNANSHLLCLPPGYEFPLQTKTAPVVPSSVLCGVKACKNLKKYSCSKSGVPLCSLACYKVNKRLLVPMSS